MKEGESGRAFGVQAPRRVHPGAAGEQRLRARPQRLHHAVVDQEPGAQRVAQGKYREWASSPVTLNMNSMSLRQLGDLPKILFPRPCDRRDASLCVETWQEKGEGILLYTQQQQLGSTDNPNE